MNKTGYILSAEHKLICRQFTVEQEKACRLLILMDQSDLSKTTKESVSHLAKTYERNECFRVSPVAS